MVSTGGVYTAMDVVGMLAGLGVDELRNVTLSSPFC